VLAVIPFARFLILWFSRGETAGNVQSLIFGSIMSVAALLSRAGGHFRPAAHQPHSAGGANRR
jgi:hypothetical protein